MIWWTFYLGNVIAPSSTQKKWRDNVVWRDNVWRNNVSPGVLFWPITYLSNMTYNVKKFRSLWTDSKHNYTWHRTIFFLHENCETIPKMVLSKIEFDLLYYLSLLVKTLVWQKTILLCKCLNGTFAPLVDAVKQCWLVIVSFSVINNHNKYRKYLLIRLHLSLLYPGTLV